MNWTITTLDRLLPDGMVYTAYWVVSKTEGGASGAMNGSISFPAKDPSDPNFIPYDDLTEEQVVNWVKTEMGGNQVAAYEAAVQAQIDKQINPKTASGVPW